MPITVTVKSRASKSKGLPPSWNATVKGAAELFTPRLERILFLNGLNGMPVRDGPSVWTSAYAVGPPPLYLAALLKGSYGARPDYGTARMLDEATGPFEDGSGLTGLMRYAPSPGGSPLGVTATSQDFVANCDAGNSARADLLEGAGWLPISDPPPVVSRRFGTRPFRTRDPFIASNMAPFMDAQARARLGVEMKRGMDAIAASKSFAAPDGFDVPSPDGIDYKPFQKNGIATVVASGKGAIIADDMGLGKTIQGIGIVNGRPGVKNVIVLCKANMRLKWVMEIEKWRIDETLTVGHAEGNEWPDTNIVVINYDIADRHAANIRSRHWDVALIDQAESVKNEETKRTIAVLGDLTGKVADTGLRMAKGGQIVHLTGCPKPNRISELWPLLTSSRGDLWGRGPEAKRAFLNRYEPPVLISKEIARGGRTFRKILALPGKPRRELELQMRLRGSGSFVRRMKRDTDMPEKFRTPIPLPYRLSREDIDALKAIDADIDEIRERTMPRGGAVDVGRSERARQAIDIVTGVRTSGVGFEEKARLRRNVGILKAPLCARFIAEELLEDKDLPEEYRRKTVIFAHHKDVVDIIARTIDHEIPGAIRTFDGRASMAKREAMKDAFQEDPSVRAIIISLAGATGITLTAAHRMRVVEMDWSASNMAEIEDRIWRIGQEKICDIGYPFIPNSTDIDIGMALIEKMNLDDRVLNTMSFEGMRSAGRAPEAAPAEDAPPAPRDDPHADLFGAF